MNDFVDHRVEELLERVVRFHPCGLRLLTGDVPDLDLGRIQEFMAKTP